MQNKKPDNLNIVCFGEVLFDIFPNHTKIGGAPLNVALRLASLGINTSIISKIGDDNLGKEMLDFISESDVNTDLIQVDETLSTGEVFVKLDEKGSASYTINYPAAWDKITFEDNCVEAVKNSDAFIFGTLACRDEVSFSALKQLLPFSKHKILDVNLRKPHYTFELLHYLMNEADLLKFNDEELFEIADHFNSPFHNLEQNILFISEKTNTKNICVTKGNHGAVLLNNGKFYYNSGFRVKVVDTVGSGDSFLAGLISQLTKGEDPQKAIDFACALGALVTQTEGANSKISHSELEKFINPL
ncbi:carbohydrate kinase family protein [Halpernia frigidisoli]|uniref:Fructokinase n=1 Tax=Halpernia frigidisoli TaxID=1125876 RepID=A0A1I3H1I1_9FLAO|nr:carbohydrate kinase [Halpernia frigidisoli]SFI29594.1 fructokinase [Halpernia frigidisoli]